MSPPSTRFGILGTGRITRRLVADIQSTPGASVTAIASRELERARWCADQYGIANAVQGYSEMLQREDVDAVYIALPPAMHTEWALATAQAGKHLLCEKPLAVSFQHAKSIHDACQAARVRWLDATGWLHHGRTDQFARWIQDGYLGTVRHVSASVSFLEPFQSGEHRLVESLGGGCLLDLGWYTAGLMVFTSRAAMKPSDDDTAGAPTIRVRGSVIKRGNVSLRLTAIAELTGGGLEDTISSTLSCGYDTATRKWFEVAGSRASLICDDFTRPWAERPTRCWIHDATGAVEPHTFEDAQERGMIGRLIGNQGLHSFHHQALATQSVLEAIEASVNQGGEQVEAVWPSVCEAGSLKTE